MDSGLNNLEIGWNFEGKICKFKFGPVVLPSKHQLGDFTSIESAPSPHSPATGDGIVPWCPRKFPSFLVLYKMIKSLIEICEAELFLFDSWDKNRISVGEVELIRKVEFRANSTTDF